jgi:hypothetical protein
MASPSSTWTCALTADSRAWLGAALCAVAVAACGDKQVPDVAELTEVLSGGAQRSTQGATWQASGAGDRFREGDAVRTTTDGGARLRFIAGGGLRMGPATTIRFGRGALAVDGELEAEGEQATLELEMGRARIAPGTRVRIGQRGGQVRFDVLVGSAVVSRDQRRVEVSAGQAVAVDVKAGAIERVAGAGARATDVRPERAGGAARAGEGSTAEMPPETSGREQGAEVEGAAEGAVTAGGAGDAADSDGPESGAAVAGAEVKTGTPPVDAASAARRGAVVGEVRGAPVRMRGSARQPWRQLAPGRHELAGGAELSIPRGGAVALARGGESAVVHGAADVVVAPRGRGGALVETRSGRADVRAIDAEVAVRVPGGMIVARRGSAGGSRAELGVERGETSVAVTAGVVDVSGDQGGAERLLTGQTGAVERGGGLRVLGRPPERADFSIAAGLTATIHDPAPPTDVKIRFDTLCREAGVLELAHGESFRAARVMVQGRGAAIGRFPRGAHRYRVRCFEGDVVGDVVVASGRLRVTRDSGTRPLALGAPNNTVDADGRRYTVLYQNRLPAITFRWPGAPEAARYRLVVAPGRGRRIEVDLASSTHGMSAGALAEGQYRFWFKVIGSARESRKSALTIDFDNAARSGYVMAPRPDADWHGPSVSVSGAAIEGWRVEVGGAVLELDRQHRFSGDVRRADDENGIALEFSHPTHGVHLYVRRGKQR